MKLMTCSLLTRVCTPEIPYLKAFLRHHQALGFDLVDALIQEPKLINVLDSISKDLDLQIRVSLQSMLKTPAEVLHEAPVHTERDYVLLLDPDEYLYLPGHENLASFLDACDNPDSCYFRWVVSPSDFDAESRRLGYLGHIGKHLALSKFVVGVATAHTFKLQEMEVVNPFKFDRHDGFVVHYWGRSFRDVLLKCLYYRGVHKSKQSSIEEVKSCCNGSELPGRLKLLAALNLHCRYILTPDYLEGMIDYCQEDSLLKACLLDGEVEAIKSSYLGYKSFLENPNNGDARALIAGYPGSYSIQKLADYLPACMPD